MTGRAYPRPVDVASVVPSDRQVDDAADGDRHGADDRPGPLRQVAHGIGPGEVDPALDDETGRYDSEDEKRHGDGLRAGDDHRSSIRAFMASGSEQPTIHAS